MALKDYVVPSAEVRIDANTTFTVRGISFKDMTDLAARHAPALALAYAKFVVTKEDIGLRPETIGQIIYMVAEEFPEIVHSTIALAADEKGMETIIEKLPVGVQLEALEKTVALTFSGEADIKKLVETITRMVQGVTAVSDNLTKPLTPTDNGSGAFVSN